MDEFEDLSWDTPQEPPENALAIVHGKTVILVRHFFRNDSSATETSLISELIRRKSNDI